MIVNTNPIEAELTVAEEQAQELSVNGTQRLELTAEARGSANLHPEPNAPVPMDLDMRYQSGSVNAIWGQITGNIEDQEDLQEALEPLKNIKDLGNIDLDPYDYYIWNYLDDHELTEPGTYKAFDIGDGFYYWITVERAGELIYQEVWNTEEGPWVRNGRQGYHYNNTWEYDDVKQRIDDPDYYYDRNTIDNKLSQKVDNDTLGNYYTKDEVDELIAGGGGGGGLIETTWANLVQLRDNAQLVKGAFYRITDYNFVTTKLGIQSGNHQFDILLLAISENMLSESGYACRHAGDHYFEREITEGGIEWLYTLYVDDYGESYGDEPMDHQDDLHSSDEFCDSGVLPHPDTGDNVPVLYKTDTGEYSTDDPDYEDAYFYEGTYDLDGDEYDLWSKYEQQDGEWVFMQQYALTPIVVEDGELIVSPIPETKMVPVNMNAWELKYCLDNDKDLFDWAETDGKGVIYWLKDEFGNEAPYDFKNAMFRRYQVATVSNSILNSLRNLYLYQDDYYAVTRNNNQKYWYTYASIDGTSDGSLFGECTFNSIQPYIYLSPKGKNIRGINNIVLQNANRNRLGYNCYDITILNSADNNEFNNSYKVCGVSFASTKFASRAYAVTLSGSSQCTFGPGCNNIMGQGADNCELGNNCSTINLGIYNTGNKLGNSCRGITFGQWCYSNTFGTNCDSITVGNYFTYNTIGKSCSNITATNYYRYNNIEDYVVRVTLNTTGGSTSQYVQFLKLCRGLTNKTLTPVRRATYEQIYYTTGRQENAV